MARVTDKDKGYKALMARITKAAQGAHVDVGLIGDEADKPHEGSELTVAEIGEIHEFGLGSNPVRSWLRGYVDENKSSIQTKIRRVAQGVESGSLQLRDGFNLLGLDLVGGIRKRIAAGIAPPVTAATQARKGPDKTTALINSGQFRSSITHKVETGE